MKNTLNLRIAGVAILVAIATSALAEIKMAVLANGKQVGVAILSQRITPSGQKIVDLNMTIDGQDRKATVRSESVYDATGAPIRKFQESTLEGTVHSRRAVIVTFDGDGANVVIDENGTRTTKHVSLLTTAPRKDASEYWFVRDQPQVGEVATAYRFNLDSLGWDLVKTEFKGSRPMMISGRRVATRVTSSEEGTAFLDQDGLPLRLELPDATLERIWETS